MQGKDHIVTQLIEEPRMTNFFFIRNLHLTASDLFLLGNYGQKLKISASWKRKEEYLVADSLGTILYV